MQNSVILTLFRFFCPCYIQIFPCIRKELLRKELKQDSSGCTQNNSCICFTKFDFTDTRSAVQSIHTWPYGAGNLLRVVNGLKNIKNTESNGMPSLPIAHAQATLRQQNVGSVDAIRAAELFTFGPGGGGVMTETFVNGLRKSDKNKRKQFLAIGPTQVTNAGN